MLKKFIFTMAAVSAVSLFISCNNAGKKDVPVTLLMAELNPPESIVGQMDQAFVDKVSELSKGSIKIELQCSGILGDENQVMNTVMNPEGSIQMMRTSANISGFGAEKSKLITIPFTFSNENHFWTFAKSELAQEMLNEPYEKGIGVKGLFYAEEGFRHFFAVSELKNLSDLKDKKFRVSSSKTLQNLMKALKAEPVEIKYTDLYAALQTGKADGADQPLSNYYSNGFHIVAPYVILDGHMLGAVQVVINSKVWDNLSENQKKILKTAGDYASDYCRQIVNENEALTIATLKAEGAKISEVNDISEWQQACAPVINELSAGHEDLYKKILQLAK